MTNKRKKLARELTAKGMSYQAAINTLDKGRKKPRTNLRELLAADERDGLFDGRRMGSTPYEKDREVTAYIVGYEGDSIFAISKPREVLAPFVKYEREVDVKLRIEALFDAVAICRDEECPLVNAETLLTTLESQLGAHPAALLVDTPHVERVLEVAGDIPVYTGSMGHRLFAISSRERAGAIATNPEGEVAMIVNHRKGGIAVVRIA